MDQQNLFKRKLEEAKTALIGKQKYFTADSEGLVDEFRDLSIDQTEDIWPLLISLFGELELKDYIGAPLLGTASINVPEFFTFCWESKILEGKATLKFALNSGHFYYISLKKTC